MDKSTRLAYDRTWLSFERTMQAWIRTAISLITFGFSVYRLVDLVETNPAEGRYRIGVQVFGFILVGIGFLALAISTVEYRQSIRVLREEYGQSPRSTSVFFAGLVAALGIFALVSMIIWP
jgi:putative membrane protein